MLRAMRLKIRRLDSTISLPTYATGEAAGFDLAASQDVSLAPGQIALVPNRPRDRGAGGTLPRHFCPKQHPAQARIADRQRGRRSSIRIIAAQKTR